MFSTFFSVHFSSLFVQYQSAENFPAVRKLFLSYSLQPNFSDVLVRIL